LTAGALYINDYNIWTANGTVIMGDPSSNSASLFFVPGVGLSIEGSVTATSGKIASFEINGDFLNTGGSFLGQISLGPLTTGYNGAEAGALEIQTRDYDNTLVTSILRGQDISVYVPGGTDYSILNRDGLETTGGVIYNTYSSNQIAFYWDGTDIYAIIDGSTQICLSQCGSGGVTVTPSVASVDTVTPTVDPVAECPTCPTHVEPCCPPAQCWYDEVKLGHFCA
jgi:hypothetical protein